METAVISPQAIAMLVLSVMGTIFAWKGPSGAQLLVACFAAALFGAGIVMTLIDIGMRK